jgi:NADH:ubiquinone oxidoreductase subunit 6 (subunit J)
VVNQESVLLTRSTNETSNTQLIGKGLMSNYLMPFEIVGVLLLVILIGVLAISAAASEIGRTK